MSIKKIALFVLAAVVIVTGILFYQGYKGVKNNQNGSLPDKVVKISHMPLSSAFPVFIAKEKGFFQKNGVNVELTELANSNLNAEAVQSGSADLNFHTNDVATIGANENDPNKVLIYSATSNNFNTGFDGVFVKSSSEIKNVQQLAGQKIGVFPGNGATNTLKSSLKKKGIDISKIEFVQLPPANQKNALDTGAVNGLFTYEPLVSTLKLSKDYTQIYTSVLFENPDAASGLATINKNFLTKYPVLSKATVKSIDEGIEYMKSNQKESRQIISKYIKTDPAILDTFSILNFSKSTELNEQKMQDYFDYLLEIGTIKNKVNATNLIYKP
jgi:ABC-type nitrate/sulfonate/bicarbonate transport system substrate-binding protein